MADENDINDRLDQIDAVLGKYQNSAVSQTNAYINLLQKRANGERITAGDLAKLTAEVNRASDAFKQMRADFMEASAGAVKLTGSLGRGSDGFDLFNDAIDIAVKGIKGMFGMLNGIAAKLNPIAGQLTGVVTEFGKGVTEIAGDLGKYFVGIFDEGYKTFTNLSKVGAIGADGIVGMAKQFETLELPMSKFQSLVSSNANTLAMLGTTVSDAVGTVANVAGDLKRSGVDQELRNLGFTSQEIADSMIAYSELQRIMGQNAFNDQAKLAQGTMAYAKELDTIARLTGKSREETQRALQAQMRETRFRNKIQAMMAAGQTQAAQELQRAVLVQTQMGNTQMAKAIMDASTGIYNSPEAISAVTSMRGFAQNVDGLTRGMKESDFTQNLQDASKETVKNFNMLGQAVGDASVVTRLNTEQNNLATAKQGKYAEARAKAEEQLNDVLSKPNQQTQDLATAARNLDSAAAKLQGTLMQTATMPALMKEASIAMHEGVNLLTNAIKAFKDDRYVSPPATKITAEQQAENANKLDAQLAEQIKNNTYNAEQVELLKQIANPPETLAPGDLPGYSPTNPEPGITPLLELGLGQSTNNTTPLINPNNIAPPAKVNTPTGPSVQAPTSQSPNATQALPPKQEMPASSNEPQGAMNINGMNELIAASNMQGQKLDRIEAALKKGNSITANS